MRTRRKYLRALLAAMAMAVMLPQPTSAHPDIESGWPPGNRSGIIGGVTGLCVHGQVVQEHAWHKVSTFRSNCNNIRAAWHEQYQQYFKQGFWGGGAEYCFDNGWHRSNGAVNVYTNHWGWDIGHWCNCNGAHHNIYVDSWQYSWDGGWVGGAWRPATRHCHCL